jgi:hypothetical protein
VCRSRKSGPGPGFPEQFVHALGIQVGVCLTRPRGSVALGDHVGPIRAPVAYRIIEVKNKVECGNGQAGVQQQMGDIGIPGCHTLEFGQANLARKRTRPGAKAAGSPRSCIPRAIAGFAHGRLGRTGSINLIEGLSIRYHDNTRLVPRCSIVR